VIDGAYEWKKEKRIMTITPSEFAERRAREDGRLVLLDVRTDTELGIARIDPCLHIVLDDLPERYAELEPHKDATIVCLCHHGVRSAMAQRFLAARGFEHVLNLTGGIDAYAQEVDPALPRY